MEITKDTLEKITELAKLLYTQKEIAIITEIDLKKFKTSMYDETSQIYKAYMSGILQSQLEIRKAIIKSAERGSTQAQKMYLELQSTMEQKNTNFK